MSGITTGDLDELDAVISRLRTLGVTQGKVKLPSGLEVEFTAGPPESEPLETIDDAKAEKERKSELARALHV